MKRLLIGVRDNPEPWAVLFAAELPDHEILTAPAAGSIAYLAAGRPDPGLIAGLEELELIVSLNAGVEHLLAPGEVPPTVPIARLVDPGLTDGMVEWVLAQVLAWHRNLFDYAASQRVGAWAPRPEVLARERTVTVLGRGALGRPVAEALGRLGFQMRTWSRGARDDAEPRAFSGKADLPAALDGADVLVNLLPHTPETRDLLDAAAFGRLAPGALVVNGGRGATIVDADLIAALDSGRLGAAALDVFRQEPLPADHPFWTHPKVRLSPHVAAPTHPRTAVAAIAETIRRWERGEPLPNLVDRALGY